MLLIVGMLAGGVVAESILRAHPAPAIARLMETGSPARGNRLPRGSDYAQLMLAAGFIGKRREKAFTLIELSIVLVIIGLIVGGVLTGQSLIAAAEVRAQITQIEKYNSAVNTFRGKFNAIPGDMTAATGQQFGFNIIPDIYMGAFPGHRNGDGLVQGSSSNYLSQGQCETGMFWMDLSSPAAGGLIEGQFPNSGALAFACGNSVQIFSVTSIGQILPKAKLGQANSIYVYTDNNSNWFGISAVQSTLSGGNLVSNAVIPVIQAYRIDAKIDDGLPQSGNMQATYINTSQTTVQTAPNTTTSGGNSTSCYDTTTGTYSVTVNNGNGGNCALSFKFQ